MLGPLLFLIYINDITDDLASLPLIYADDTTLLQILDGPAVSAGRLNSDLNKIAVWADKWLVTMNPVLLVLPEPRSYIESDNGLDVGHPQLTELSVLALFQISTIRHQA